MMYNASFKEEHIFGVILSTSSHG